MLRNSSGWILKVVLGKALSLDAYPDTVTGSSVDSFAGSEDFDESFSATVIPPSYPDDDDPSAATTNTSVGGRIINGKAAPVNEFRFIVSIRRDDSHICGGSLMPDLKSVITAAHCVHEEKSGRRIPVRELSIAVGIRRLISVPFSNIITVREAVVHPDYHHKKILNDIAILRLAGSAAGKRNVSSVKLPPAHAEPAPGTSLHTAGWGRTQEGQAGAASVQLLKTTLKVVDRERCRRSLGGRGRSHIPPSQICTENQASGTCNGDSGGPLVNRRSGVDFLVGLTSYGLRGCTLNTLDVFTKVSHFTDWIQRVASGENPAGTQPTPAPGRRTTPDYPPWDADEDNNPTPESLLQTTREYPPWDSSEDNEPTEAPWRATTREYPPWEDSDDTPTPASWRRTTREYPLRETDDDGRNNGVLQPGGCVGGMCGGTNELLRNCRTVAGKLLCQTEYGEMPCQVSGNTLRCSSSSETRSSDRWDSPGNSWLRPVMGSWGPSGTSSSSSSGRRCYSDGHSTQCTSWSSSG
ncbi:polyserase-2-like [Paramacrobiotus metropolitanus]|uniref:polyserase-2-like n=1 Tax=Paramacrobiotus metropolitanus TaxID=2943436 RepID=UPI002445CC39|nr:polyserase-2-like [Paramacrobiotus metropolitanus]